MALNVRLGQTGNNIHGKPLVALLLPTDDSAALQRRRTRQDALKSYYSLADEPMPASSSACATSMTSADVGSCDINGPSFEPDVYLNRLIKERSLTELMDKEAEMVQHIKSLDSDMQTLVYENYNKFISATDTIRTVRLRPIFMSVIGELETNCELI